MSVIYLDNAATTRTKPQSVVDAVAAALTSFGGPGRGAHDPAVDASMAVYRARAAVAGVIGAPSPARVSFAANATAALNVAIAGLLPIGGRAVTTAASHNSVLRPLFRARDERDCAVNVVPVNPDGSLDYGAYARCLDRGADLVAVTHASNLTGDVYDVARLAALAHEAGARFVLDAAQTAGAHPLDMAALGADVVCFTGHKSLYGPQGTGGLAVAEGVDVPPLLEGGSGVHSFDERHPRFMPEALEAGTANAHGLAGLAAGAAYVAAQGVEAIAAQLAALVDRFEAGAAAVPGVRVLGGHADAGRCGIVALNVGAADSGAVADALFQGFGVCVRPGAHCAPLTHRALGTEQQGAVRFSFCSFTTEAEVDAALEALEAVARDLC